MTISRLLSLKDRVPFVDPLHSSSSFQVDFLGLEAARAAVNDHTRTFNLVTFLDILCKSTNRCN